ncbi:hypothetical protein A33Q_2935 [Indibacter alkaliphilus LW1]|uniref:Uncharacterized protein n=2 Tax=Indibacter TaxID=647744 RepID=S2E0K9_INDAL|nr:hypothetical protein A33Q_2935 [Indibacter alkaliphilus LW1]
MAAKRLPFLFFPDDQGFFIYDISLLHTFLYKLKKNPIQMKVTFSTLTLQEEAVKTQSNSATSIRQIPTYVYASVFSSLCIVIGLIWDISWHMSVGRDTLFSPPHIAIYVGAVIAGVFSGIKVLKTSFWGTTAEKSKAIKFWGIFHGSLGAMFCIWGAFAMLTSAPFDDWWHNTYGLDVQILSPPHVLLGLGMIMIQFGAMISVTALQNRLQKNITENTYGQLQWMYALTAGILLAMVYVLVSQYFWPFLMHGALMYQIAALTFPLFMISVTFAAPYKWACTKMALAYTLIMAAMVWILPLFPAEPRLSPVYNHITTLQAYHFPILLIVPAVAIDLIMARFKHINKWLLSCLLAVAFLGTFVPAQWYFAEFLHTEAARGWFFGRSSWSYMSSPDYAYRYAFVPSSVDTGWALVKGLLIALPIAWITSRIGLSWGNWMKQVKR